MKTDAALQIRTGCSSASDPHRAVAEVQQQIQQAQTKLILFFCSPAYDLGELAAGLRAAFDPVPCVGCTAAGQLDGQGFSKGGLTAVSLAGDISAHPYVVDLAAMERTVPAIADAARAMLTTHPDRHSFGLLLVDGLSRKEETLASLLYRHLPRVPVVGGSASDDLNFRQTHVYADGIFRTQVAVFVHILTRLPFRPIKFAHFVPTDRTLVVTRSDPEKRVVHEINGEPAAMVFAELVGLPIDRLNASAFSLTPLIFETGGEQYVRSIARVNPDQSLTLFCAVENGMVLSLGMAVDPVTTAEAAFQKVRDEIGEPVLVIGCDCILRRLEFENHGTLDAMGDLMQRNHVFGFSTYGEQYEGLHVNQTFTGVAIGNNHAPA